MPTPRLLDISTRVVLPDGATARPGDTVRLVARARVEGEAELRFPSAEELEKALAGSGRVLAGPELATIDGELEAAWDVQLLLPPGEQELGPVPVALVAADGSVIEEHSAPAAPVEVASSLPAELAARLDEAADQGALPQLLAEELAPPRGPWTLQGRFPWELGLAGAGGLLVLALVGVWAWRRHLRLRPPAALPPVRLDPPEVEARARLAELPKLLDRGEHLAFHVELARVLKRYLGRRHEAELLELTTDEVRRLLQGPLRDAANLPRCRDEVLRVLSACDLVKFAKDLPGREDSMRLLQAVESVVERTTPAPAAAAEVAA